MHIYIKNTRKSSHTEVLLEDKRINILKLEFGDYIDQLPSCCTYFSDTRSKIIEGPKTLKIYVSNVNKHDMTFRVITNDSKSAESIALAHLAYPTAHHSKPSNLLFRKKQPSPPKETNVVHLFHNRFVGNIFKKPTHED